MATQTLRVSLTTGQTLTAKVATKADPSTVVQTASGVTEVVNNQGDPTGLYECVFTDLPAGDYFLFPLLDGTSLGPFAFQVTLTTATFDPIIGATASEIAEEVKSSFSASIPRIT